MAVAQAETLARLNEVVTRVRERVPFYRDRLPDRPLASLEQFAELPTTTKDDFRQAYPFGMLAVPLTEVVRVHASSGTTGRPVITAYTWTDLEQWGECMERVYRAGDVTAGDVVQNAYGYGLFTGGLGFHLGAERLGCTVIPTSSGVTQRQVMLMADLGTTVLACTPSYALVLAEAIAQEAMRPAIKLRVGFFGAEPWSDGMRRQIQYGLGLEAFDIYGLTELGGPGVAVECHQHAGLHIAEDHFYAESVDAETGFPVPRGEAGELVLTSLRREASPVLRYRTRDRTILTDEPCPCGSPFVRMLKVSGRTDDMIVVRGENVFPSQIEAILLSIEGLTANYQIVVDREARHLDSVEVVVEAAAHTDHAALQLAAEEAIRETIGLRAEISILPPGVLPRSEGKAKRVIDRRTV
ncbi:MAG: phenylacetate--CoA ligase [Chloroflexota bacterium]